MQPIKTIEELHKKLTALVPEGERVCIGIDGMDGIGKTPLARELAGLLNATLISLDDYLDQNQKAYAAHIRCADIRKALERAKSPILIEGVCLRAVAERCSFRIHLHVSGSAMGFGIRRRFVFLTFLLRILSAFNENCAGAQA
jgi:hypothetical protein